MDAREKTKQRMAARKAISDFFSQKRKALGVKSLFDFSLENVTKRKFMVEMNAIGRDAELAAMALSDKGKDWQPVFENAKKKFEELKDRTVKGLMPGEAIGKPLEAIASIIRSL
ncbi:MAG: hypothetical protein GOV00_00315 [Candidatus Altiarchaeota archaeon]|nr:hypothetical protein [Candidatus Altiarchaeota archaeon]